MPANFTVQDAAGDVVNANAYITVAFFKQYMDDRGRTYPADAAIQLGIVKATDYVDTRWRLRFAGLKGASAVTASAQATEWPRHNITDDAGNDIVGIPVQLQKAVAEYAQRAIVAELVPDGPLPVVGGERQPTGEVVATNVTIGPVHTGTTFMSGADSFGNGTATTSAGLLQRIPAADLLIEPLLDAGGLQRRAIRA